MEPLHIEQLRLLKFRVTVGADRITAEIELFARSEAEVCALLDACAPGLSGQVAKITRDECWWLVRREIAA